MQNHRKIVALLVGGIFLAGCGSKPAPPGPVALPESPASAQSAPPAETPKAAEPTPSPSAQAAPASKPVPHPAVAQVPKPKPGNRNLKVLPGPVTPEVLGLPFPPGSEMVESECAAVEINGTRTVRAVFTSTNAPAEVQKFYAARTKVTSKEEIEIEGSPVTHVRGAKGAMTFDISATVPQGSDRTRVKIETTRPAP